MKPLNIAFLHLELGLGGAERLMVDAAVALRRRGHSVTMLTTSHPDRGSFPETRDGSFRVEVLGSWLPHHLGGRLLAACAVVRMIYLSWCAARRRDEFDLYLCDLVSHAVPFLRLWSGRPVVFYGHYPDQLLAPPGARLLSPYRRALDVLEERGLAAADRVLVNSRFTAGVFRRCYPDATAPVVLHPGVDLDRFGGPRATGPGILILTIQRFDPAKNHMLALEMLHHLRAISPETASRVRLLLAGGMDPTVRPSVEYLRHLEGRVRDLGLEGQVTFVENPRDSELAGWLARADLLVHTPPFEHFGIVPVEAMAAGVPVVACRGGGLPETVVDGRTGLLCAPDGASFAVAARRLIEDPELRAEMGRAARDHAAGFGRSRFGERLEEELRIVLPAGPSFAPPPVGSFDPFSRLIRLNLTKDRRIPTTAWRIFNFLLSCMIFFVTALRRRDPRDRFHCESHPQDRLHVTGRPVRFWGWVDPLEGDRPVVMNLTWGGSVTVIHALTFPAHPPDEFSGAPEGGAAFVLEFDTSAGLKLVSLEVEYGSGARRYLGCFVFFVPWRFREFPRSAPAIDYRAWTVRYSDQDRPEMEREELPQEHPSRISVLVQNGETGSGALRRTLESILEQWHLDWELLLHGEDPSMPVDPRIRVVPSSGDPIEDSNRALDLATGSLVALVDTGDLLAPNALREVAKVWIRHSPDLLYTDEDFQAGSGLRDPVFKSAYSPDHLLSHFTMDGLLVLRKEAIRLAGGFRPGFEGAQRHDLVLRVLEVTERVAHLPRVLCHRASRAVAPEAWDGGLAAVRDAVRRRGIEASVERGLQPLTYRVRRRHLGTPRVSILVPFRDRWELTSGCLRTVLARTTYPDYEIVLIDNGSVERRTLDGLAALAGEPRVRLIRCDIPFNYSRLNNIGAREARGEQLVFLNNDTEVISPGWIEALLEHSQRPEVGVVGARLLFADGTIQHAGVVVGLGGAAAHPMLGMERDTTGCYLHASVVRNVSSVTAACMMMKRQLFLDLDGFEEEGLPVAFNDVDLALRARERGLLNVFTPYCEMYHLESKSRGRDETHEQRMRAAGELVYFRRRHERALRAGDPYYNPNLTLCYLDYSLGDPSPVHRAPRVMGTGASGGAPGAGEPSR